MNPFPRESIPRIPSEYYPDRWLLLEVSVVGVEKLFKVFGVWQGGYLHGDSWRVNSGIESVKLNENFIHFYGYSGSCYTTRMSDYGTTVYGSSVIADMLDSGVVRVVDKEDVMSVLIENGFITERE